MFLHITAPPAAVVIILLALNDNAEKSPCVPQCLPSLE